MRLAFFVDGSHQRSTQTGGYGVVWNRYATAPDQAQLVGKAVALSGEALSSGLCELLAIIEGLHLMKTEFTRMMAARVGREHGVIVEATGMLFSDSRTNLDVLQRGTCAQSLYMKLVEACFEAAHELQTVPGLRVSLELRWVPGRVPSRLLVGSHNWAHRLGWWAREFQVSGMYVRAAGGEEEQARVDADAKETFWAKFMEKEGLMAPVDEGVNVEEERWEVAWVAEDW